MGYDQYWPYYSTPRNIHRAKTTEMVDPIISFCTNVFFVENTSEKKSY